MSNLPWDYDSDGFVEDSEPEREELRKRDKEKRMTKILTRQDAEIAEITDTELVATAVVEAVEVGDEGAKLRSNLSPEQSVMRSAKLSNRPGVSRSNSVIEISDDSSRGSPALTTPPIMPQNTSVLTNDSLPAAVPSLNSPSKPLSSSSTLGDSDNNKGDNLLKLNKFAYTNGHARPTRSLPGPSRTPSISSITSMNAPRKKKQAPCHRFATNFSDLELRTLLKCVSCDIHWTARKSVAQKMMHIQSCATKNSLTDETVQVLLRKEIGNSSVAGKGNANANGTLEVAEPSLNTYLEDIINDAGPKKKGKRLEISKTVRSVTETRGVILDKARAVLGNPATSQSTQTKALGPSRLQVVQPLDDPTLPPATQAFGQSALGQRNILLQSSADVATFRQPYLRLATFDSETTQEDDIDMTPTCTPSKLASNPSDLNTGLDRRHPSSPLSHSAIVNKALESPISSIPFTSHPFPSDINLEFLSANEHSRFNHQRVSSEDSPGSQALAPFVMTRHIPKNQASTGPNHEHNAYEHHDHGEFGSGDEWNDDAYLHYSPNGCTNNIALYQDETTSEQDIDRTTTGREPNPPHKPASSSDSDPPATPTKHATKKTNTIRRVDDKEHQPSVINDEHWEAKMEAKIIKDETLHLRILRYEPIHFDIFLQMAQKDFNSRGLKFRLRSLLDKLCVNFYGAEAESHTGGRH